MHNENTEQWIRDLFTSIDNKNSSSFANFLSEDVNFRFANMPGSRGKLAVTEQVSCFFDSIQSLKHNITEFWKDNDAIICHGTVYYTRHDDSTLKVPFSNIFKLHQSRIREYLIFVDISELYQIG